MYFATVLNSLKLEQKVTFIFVFKFWNDVIMQYIILSCVNNTDRNNFEDSY